MRNTYVLPVLLLSGLAATGCSSDEEQISVNNETIEMLAHCSVDEVWHTSHSSALPAEKKLTRAVVDENTRMGLYVIDSNGKKLKSLCSRDNSTFSYPMELPSVVPGVYRLCALYGPTSVEMPKVPTGTDMTVDTAWDLPASIRDLYLGEASFTVENAKRSYQTDVTLSHLDAQLGLTITEVPANVASITCELPNQASQFTLSGKILGNSRSQKFALKKSGTTSTWELAPTLVYPCADGTTKMVVKLRVEYSDGKLPVVYTTNSSYVCTKNQSVKLTTSMKAVMKADITLDETWGAEVSGSLNFGDGTVDNSSASGSSSGESASDSSSDDGDYDL